MPLRTIPTVATLSVMGKKHAFDEDTKREIVLPRPMPEVTDDGLKSADGGFDEMEIEVDDDEVSAEETDNHPARKN